MGISDKLIELLKPHTRDKKDNRLLSEIKAIVIRKQLLKVSNLQQRVKRPTSRLGTQVAPLPGEHTERN